MRQTIILGLVVALAAVLVLAADSASWTGYITDEHCGAKHEKGKGADACFKMGAKAALLVDNSKVFKLDKHDLAAPHAGHHVKVTGKLDKKTNTIAVEKIEMAEEKGKK